MSSLELKSVDHRIGSLDDLKITFDVGTLLKEKDDPETMQLVSQIYELNEQHKVRVEQIKANTIEYLDQCHEAAVVAARVAKEAFESTNLYGSRFTAERRELDARLSRAHLNLRTTTMDKPNPTYALKANYAAHQKRVEEAQAEVQAALNAQYRLEADVQHWRSNAESRRAELAEAVRVEEDLRWRLNKAKGIKQEPKPDRNTGFMMS